MKIILIGFMGSGKTSVAKILAKKLKIPLIEMDSLVVSESKRKDIKEIFEKDGELKFRELEIKIARGLSSLKDGVISTGGGVVINKIILDYLRNDGIVIYLRTSFANVSQRVGSFSQRPLFKSKKEAKKLYRFRKILYINYADIMISTNNRTIQQVADDIINEVT